MGVPDLFLSSSRKHRSRLSIWSLLVVVAVDAPALQMETAAVVQAVTAATLAAKTQAVGVPLRRLQIFPSVQLTALLLVQAEQHRGHQAQEITDFLARLILSLQ
jgi:hypothetical protein